MPPRITVTREQVLEAAFELLRAAGPTALTARRVAGALGCSTQPVYRAYGSMEELKADVMGRADDEVMAYLAPDAGDEPPFMAVGLGSLRLARDEPHLYRAVVQSGEALREMQQQQAPPDWVLERMRAEPLLGSLSDRQLARINTLMWLFSQGVATLFLSEQAEDPMEQAEEYLMLAGRAVIESELNRSSGD